MACIAHRTRGLASRLSSAVLFIAAAAWGGTTGKIAGRVVDSDGAPLSGAAVTVEGSRLGATADADGRFVILQVQPGAQTVTAQLIGYRPTSITGIRVNADRTTQVNFVLAEEAITVNVLVVTAERPPIEQDVTSSQIVVDAQRVSEAPVSQLLDYLSYEPGVNVVRDNELEIRGGGPSEIRFQVDGLDRTDALTGKGYTQLNQTLVSEVTVLTGGFNAEYGNVRSGMVNVVTKSGTERGFGLPWVAGVANYAPAQHKHFGPGAYDEDQYDYWLMSSKSPFADSALVGPLYWPLLYDETRNAPQFTDKNSVDAQGRLNYQNPRTSLFRVFEGWTKRAQSARTLRYYGKSDWTATEARAAWEYEANMNEQAWQYANEPDRSLDLSAGWALPAKLGGLVVGYSYNKEMTPVPALRPYYRDQTLESKLTLTPTDNFKIAVSYMTGASATTGGGSKGGANTSPELQETSAGVIGADPVSLRSFDQLINSVRGLKDGNNKLTLSYNGPLDGRFTQYGTSMTYTIGRGTFATASISRSKSSWNLGRDLPRVDITDFVNRYTPPRYWGYGGWLSKGYRWTDTSGDKIDDPPTSLEDALNPLRIIYRTPYLVDEAFPVPPSKGKYIGKMLYFDDGADSVFVVSPQGYIESGYSDLSGLYTLGGGAEVTLDGGATQTVAHGDLMHVVGDHTLKTGAEYILGDLHYNTTQSQDPWSGGLWSEFRHYGGDWGAATPSVLGFYLQDKFETNGMIANVGLRVERFNGGQGAIAYDDLFNSILFVAHGKEIYEQLAVDMGWDTLAMGPVPMDYYQVKAKLGDAPTPGDVSRAVPTTPTEKHWRVAPRFGISHPVSTHTKFFFNYGVFYSLQKSSVMFGFADHDGRLGYPGSIREVYSPNLRPGKTTMYEIGVEHVLPAAIVTTVRGYAKHNVDQVTGISVNGSTIPGFWGYTIYRNANWEDVQGMEVKIARSAGRFVNGWFSYERAYSRSGWVGISNIDTNPDNISPFTAFARTSVPNGFFRALLRLGTPADWGPIAGTWSLSIIQAYQSGGQSIYNPDAVPERDLPKEYFLPVVDYWNTDLKIGKGLRLPGGRSVTVSLDMTNALDTRRINGSGVSNWTDYLAQIVYLRRKGQDVEVGDPRTFKFFDRPYQDENGNWHAPLSPRTEWLHYLDPRYYRFGLRFDL